MTSTSKHSEPHFVGRVIIERVEFAPTTQENAHVRRTDEHARKEANAKGERKVVDIAQITVKDADLDSLKGRLMRHIEIVEDL